MQILFFLMCKRKTLIAVSKQPKTRMSQLTNTISEGRKAALMDRTLLEKEKETSLLPENKKLMGAKDLKNPTTLTVS